MAGSHQPEEPNPKSWGRRPYAGKRARELLNDVSMYVARTRPDDVDDPSDPSLDEVLSNACDALTHRPDDVDPKASTLVSLIRDHGLTFQEAVCWYWFRHCRYDVTEIHFATSGRDVGGDPSQRRSATRSIHRVLKSAASKIPGEDPDEIAGRVDDRKRHDRSDAVDDDNT